MWINCLRLHLTCKLRVQSWELRALHHSEHHWSMTVCVFLCLSLNQCLFVCFCSCVLMQAHNAEQAAVGVGRLRSRESGAVAENVLAQVGIHLHASWGTGQVSPSFMSCLRKRPPFNHQVYLWHVVPLKLNVIHNSVLSRFQSWLSLCDLWPFGLSSVKLPVQWIWVHIMMNPCVSNACTVQLFYGSSFALLLGFLEQFHDPFSNVCLQSWQKEGQTREESPR